MINIIISSACAFRHPCGRQKLYWAKDDRFIVPAVAKLMGQTRQWRLHFKQYIHHWEAKPLGDQSVVLRRSEDWLTPDLWCRIYTLARATIHWYSNRWASNFILPLVLFFFNGKYVSRKSLARNFVPIMTSSSIMRKNFVRFTAFRFVYPIYDISVCFATCLLPLIRINQMGTTRAFWERRF